MPPSREAQNGPPDLILVDGRITTLSSGSGPAEVAAVAIRDGLISATGSTAEVERLAGPSTTRVGLSGRRALPGLIDSHVHIIRAGRTWNEEVRWEDQKTLGSALAAIRLAAAGRPSGTWIRVIGGWEYDQFVERRGPTPDELDRAAPDHPVYVQYSYDWAVVNRVGIASLGLEGALPEFGSEAIECDAAGRPTGRLFGLPLMVWCYRNLPVPDFDAQVASTAAMCRELNRLGITGAIDGGGLNTGPDVYRPLYETWRRGELTVRTRLMVHAEQQGLEREELAGFRRFLPPDLGDDLLRVLGAGEIILYRSHDRIATPADTSSQARAEMYELFSDMARDRWTVHMHAHQPETIDAVLSTWKRVHREFGIDGLRWALVHAEPLSMSDIAALQAMGMGILTQPLFRSAGETAVRMWGPERVADAPPLKALREAGVPVGLGSDGMRAAPYNPFTNLAWYLRGKTLRGTATLAEHNLLTREQALRGYTADAAWFSFEENSRGRLDVGFQADIAVLTDDYFAVAAEQLSDLESVLTLVGGQPVHVGGPFADQMDPVPVASRIGASRRPGRAPVGHR